MYDLIITHGDKAALWTLAAIAALLARYVFVLIDSTTTQRIVAAAWNESASAALEVWQTWTKALKEGRADGKLTEDEKVEAKKRAIAIARKNIGKKGLARLAKIFGVDDWIGNKVEAFIADKSSNIALGEVIETTGTEKPTPPKPKA
jgi:hypothetical protein